jgi:hypothetical protein
LVVEFDDVEQRDLIFKKSKEFETVLKCFTDLEPNGKSIKFRSNSWVLDPPAPQKPAGDGKQGKEDEKDRDTPPTPNANESKEETTNAEFLAQVLSFKQAVESGMFNIKDFLENIANLAKALASTPVSPPPPPVPHPEKLAIEIRQGLTGEFVIFSKKEPLVEGGSVNLQPATDKEMEIVIEIITKEYLEKTSPKKRRRRTIKTAE